MQIFYHRCNSLEKPLGRRSRSADANFVLRTEPHRIELLRPADMVRTDVDALAQLAEHASVGARAARHKHDDVVRAGKVGEQSMATWAIILVSVWRNMGYYMVIYLAALQGVPRELYEAATVDGANKWKQFLHITLPQLRPTTFFASVMMIISCFKIYDVVAIMTDGGPGRSTKMLVTYIYEEAFTNMKYGIASAISMILLVIVLVVTILQFSMEKKWSSD